MKNLIENEIFKALSVPIRLRIVMLLIAGELCVCDLIEVLNLPQSTISRHMATLKQTGLVVDHRNWKWVHYQINPRLLNEFSEIINFLKKLSDKELYKTDLTNLEQYLKNKNNNCLDGDKL